MEIVGEEPDNEILFRMINEHSGEWEKARSMPQGYRFGMLKNMLTQEYHAWKRVMNGGHPWPDDKDGDAPFDIDEILDSMFVVHKVDPKAFRDEQPEPKVLSYDEEMMREYGMYDDFDADGL